MTQVKSIYHLILYSIIFIILLISSFTYIIIDNTFNEFQEKIATLEYDYTSKQKELIEADITKTLSFISYYHKRFKNIKSEEIIKKEILEAIEEMRDKKDINDYVFIYDFDGNSLYYPPSSDNIGKNFYSLTDANGISVIKDIIDVSKKPNGGYLQYIWYKPNIKKDVLKISYAISYNKWNWTIGTGLYLDEIDILLNKKQYEYEEKISNYTLQILSLTIMLVLYSIFLYKNATILIVNDVKEIGISFEEAEKSDTPINQNRFILGEFKIIANYANNAMNNIKLKTHMLEDLNKHLENKISEQTKELTTLVESQKQFLRNSVHEVNTPLSIIQTNIDLFRLHSEENKYLTNIQSGVKIIQNIFDDLSYMIKKDRVEYKRTIINFSQILNHRIDFFDENMDFTEELMFNIDGTGYIRKYEKGVWSPKQNIRWKINQTEIQLNFLT